MLGSRVFPSNFDWLAIDTQSVAFSLMMLFSQMNATVYLNSVQGICFPGYNSELYYQFGIIQCHIFGRYHLR